MNGARLKHYGWGREGEGMTAEEQAFRLGPLPRKICARCIRNNSRAAAGGSDTARAAGDAAGLIAAFCTSERYDRVAHAYGKSYPDYVRAMLGDYDCAPDVVAYPRNEAEISAVMDWAGGCERLTDAIRGRVERLRRCRAASRRHSP